MAKVVAGNVAIDMNDPDIGSLDDYDSAQAGPNYIALQTGGFLDEFTGSSPTMPSRIWPAGR